MRDGKRPYRREGFIVVIWVVICRVCLLHWRDFSMMLPVGWDEEKECVQADEVNDCSRLSVRG